MPDTHQETDSPARARAAESTGLNNRLQREIVERQSLEQRLRVSERQLRESQRLAGIGSWEFDPATGTAVWSEEMYRIYGVTPGTFSPTLANILALTPPEDASIIASTMARVRATLQPTEYGHGFLRPDGAARRLRGLCNFTFDRAGSIERYVGIARDVTEAHEQQAAMDRALADLRQLKDIVDRSPVVAAIVSLTPSGNTVEYVSDSVRQFGYTAADVVAGRIGWKEFMLPDERSRILAEVRGHLEAGRRQFAVTHRLVTRTGAVRWIHDDVTAVPAQAGGPGTRLQCLLTDVTAQHEAEARARELASLNRAVVTAAPVGISVYDSTGQCVFANPALSHILNASVDQIVLQNFNHIASWRDSGMLALATRAFATGEEISDVVRVRSTFGREAWLDVTFTRFDSEDGPHLLGSCHDITERRLMTVALQESEQKYRQLFESMGEGCLLHDLVYDRNGIPVDALVTSMNPAAETILGAPASEVVGKRASALVPTGRPLFLEIYAALDRGQPPVSIESYVPFAKKHLFLSFFSPSKGRIATIFKDISARKATEEQMTRYQQQLRHLAAEMAVAGEQERRRIAVNLHDGLGQSLVLCKMKLEAVKADAESPVKRQLQPIVRLIEETIRDTRSLTFQLSPPVLHEIGLSAAVEWLAEQLGRQHNVTIRVTGKASREPTGIAERITLFQSVRELLFNAIKHAQATAIEVDIRLKRDRFEIVVKDDGAGFEPETLQGLGRKGLGLFNIQERLQSIGGAMTIRSQPGEGTSITLAAPVEAAVAAGEGGTP